MKNNCQNKNCIMRNKNLNCGLLNILDDYEIDELTFNHECIHEIVGIKTIVEEIIKLKEIIVK